MQKFTRALTREIELSGLRLALTLDERGLSIRPVGSRKPPLTLSWAGCLCAAAAGEPGADQVARVLEAIRGPARPAPAAAAPAAKAEEGGLKDALARLDAWLKQHRGRYHAGLRPGATEAELGEWAEALGRPVPAGLADWLRWHNGQDEDLIGAFVESFRLMSVRDVIEESRQRRAEPGWQPAWVPILDDDQGDLVVLDTSRDGLPVREVWQGRDDFPEVAPSLEAWVGTLLRDMEAGRYLEDPERGDFIRAGGT
jgi:cell wall assembly regulator SMI1